MKDTRVRETVFPVRIVKVFGTVQNAESLLKASGKGSKRLVVRIISETLLKVLPSKAIDASELIESEPRANEPFAM